MTYENVAYVFDTAASINDPGRYINHESKNYNLVKMPPVKVGEPPKSSLKIGFVARKDIKYGEELFFHYGLKNDPDFPWIATDARKCLQHYKNKKSYIHPEQGNSAYC